jgi:peptidoglycan/LPS O-acetylase OafA/YrhL
MKYVKEFEGLRGLMALWVVIGHWATSVPLSFAPFPPKLYNAYAVDVFIMLSGFAIFTLMEQKHERFLPYITRRALRIFPVYLFFLAVSVALQPLVIHAFANSSPAYMQDRRVEIAVNSMTWWWQHLIAHVTLLHGLIPDKILPDTLYAFLGQAWSLSLEWQFYLLAPFLLLLVRNRGRLATIGIVALIVLVSVIGARYLQSGFLGEKLHLFGIGIATFYGMRAAFSSTPKFPLPKFDASVWLGALVGLLAFLLLLRTAAALPYMIWAVMLYVVLASSLGSDRLALAGSRFMNARPIQWLGHISYSVYLSHMIVIVLGLLFLEHFKGLSRYEFAFGLLAIVVPGTLALSWLTYVTIERPFMQLGKNWADQMGRGWATNPAALQPVRSARPVA